ncbi:MAG: T9SS type A sorting domain-containing protein [Flavobacteriales bacterium]|nr:T9SS type A sorting domain-containing protein [Flavobacteriales bacterium]
MRNLLLYAFMLTFSLVSYGQTITGDLADQQIFDNDGTLGNVWVGQGTSVIGNQNAGRPISVHVIPFQIPTIPVGEVVIASTFSFNLTVISDWGGLVGQADIYGLGYRSIATISNADMYATGTLVADNAMDNSSTLGVQSISNADLITYINDQITAGAVAGDYIFLRIEGDAVQTLNNRGWTISSANSASDKPTLAFTFGLSGGNHAPDFDNPIGDIVATEGIAKSVAISGTDPDGDAVTFSIAGNSSGITLTDNADGTASIDIASTVSVSVNDNITITISDGSLGTDEIISIEVVAPEANEPPVLASIGNIVTEFGTAKSVDISATDANVADVLTFSISGNPTGVDLVDNGDRTAKINISSTIAEGDYSGIEIMVSDGSLNDTETIMVKITAPADPNQKMNLDAPTADRFTLPQNLVWPTNVGEANVSLWKGDRIAATTITIDDNVEGDHAWWLSMQTKYDLDFTWFVIIGSVSNWSPYQTLIDAGNEVQAHDLAIAPDGHGDVNTYTEANYLATVKQVKDTINKSLVNNKCMTFAYPYGEQNGYLARSEYIAMRGVWGVMNYANKTNYLDIASRSATNDTYDLEILLDPSKDLWNMHFYRGLASYHYHNVPADKKEATEAFLAAVSAKSDVIWNGMFSEVTRYGQERDTHTLNVDVVEATSIRFTLTDEMNDMYFDFPLTVKIRIDNEWTHVVAEQNGNEIDVVIVENEGNKYILVDAVPDAGQVLVSGKDEHLGYEDANSEIFSIYPNPVKGVDLNVKLAEASVEQQKVELVSLSGRIVYSSVINLGDKMHNISISNKLNKGVYILRISSSSNTVSKKVIIE